MAFALQFNDAGYVDFPSVSLTGDFSITLTGVSGAGDLEVYYGQAAAASNILEIFEDEILLRFNSVFITPNQALAAATAYTIIVSRAGTTVTLDVNGNTSTMTSSATFTIDRLGDNNASGVFYTGRMDSFTIVDTAGGDNRTYDFNQTSGTSLPELEQAKHGILFSFPGDDSQWVDTAAPPVDSVTLSDPDNHRVFQRSGANASITVSGTYVGTPTAIQARIVNDVGKAEVVGWTTIDAAPAASVFSGNITVPNGGPYNVEVRFSNDTGVTDEGANAWLVGDVYIIAGQSNAQKWFTVPSAAANDSQLRFHQGGTWKALDNNFKGAAQFGVSMIASTGVPCGVMFCGVGGSALRQEAAGAGGYWMTSGDARGTHYNTLFTTQLNNAGGDIAGVVWIQGEQDSLLPVTEANYATTLGAMFGFMRSDVGNASLPIVVGYTGKVTVTATDVGLQNVRLAQRSVVEADSNAYGTTLIDIPLTDTVHFADYTEVAKRCAQAFLFSTGDATYYQGPVVTGMEQLDTTDVEFTVQHSGGTDFTPISGITGVEVLDDGTPLTNSAAVQTAVNKFKLTVTPAISGTATGRIFYGADPVTTSPLVDNSALSLPILWEDSIPLGSPPPPVIGGEGSGIKSNLFFSSIQQSITSNDGSGV